MALTPKEREVLITVIIYHWRRADSGCGCGWGDRPEHLGCSWAEHIVTTFEESVAAL